MRVEIDGRNIKSEQDLHDFLSHALDFGPYYGANLDALWDRLTTDVERPVELVWQNSALSRAAIGDERFTKIRGILLRVQSFDRSFERADHFNVTFE